MRNKQKKNSLYPIFRQRQHEQNQPCTRSAPCSLASCSEPDNAWNTGEYYQWPYSAFHVTCKDTTILICDTTTHISIGGTLLGHLQDTTIWISVLQERTTARFKKHYQVPVFRLTTAIEIPFAFGKEADASLQLEVFPTQLDSTLSLCLVGIHNIDKQGRYLGRDMILIHLWPAPIQNQ